MLPAHTLVWGAGLQANPLAESLGVDLEKGNRIEVDPELRMPLHPEVFAVGDIAWITDAGTGDVLPQLGSVALQAGEHAGDNIARVVSGKKPKPFEYKDKGTMAAIAPGAAVAATARRTNDEGKAGVPRLGSRAPDAARRMGGQDEGDGRLDLGRRQP